MTVPKASNLAHVAWYVFMFTFTGDTASSMDLVSECCESIL